MAAGGFVWSWEFGERIIRFAQSTHPLRSSTASLSREASASRLVESLESGVWGQRAKGIAMLRAKCEVAAGEIVWSLELGGRVIRFAQSTLPIRQTVSIVHLDLAHWLLSPEKHLWLVVLFI